MILNVLVMLAIASPFAILDTNMFDTEWAELDQSGTMLKELVRSGNIKGNIEILGFENMTVIDGVKYTESQSIPIFEYSTTPALQGGGNHFEKLSNNDNIEYAGNTVTASVKSTVYWHKHVSYTKHNADGTTERRSKKKDCDSTSVFKDTVNICEIYNIPAPQEIEIIEYVNATYPHTLIIVPEMSNMTTSFEVKYFDSTITKYNKYGVVQTNDNDVEYVEYFNSDQWEIDGGNLTFRNNMIVINGSPLDLPNLEISMHHAYGETDCTNYSIATSNTSIDDIFVPGGSGVVWILTIPLLLLFASKFIIGLLI